MIQWNLVCNSIKGISLQHSYIKHTNYRTSSSLCVSRDHLKTPPLSQQLSFVEEVRVGCCEFAFHLGRAGHVSSKATFWGSTSQLFAQRGTQGISAAKTLWLAFIGRLQYLAVLVSQLILSQRSVWSNDTNCGRPCFVHCPLLLFLGCHFSILVGWVWREGCYALGNTAIRFTQNNHD